MPTTVEGGHTNLGLEHNINNTTSNGRSSGNHSHNGNNGNHHPNNHYDVESARMEAWLDEHQEFAQEYFIRKATRNVVDAWLVAHATPAALAGNDMMMLVSSPTHVNQQQCSSRSGSGATTPVRYKINF
jgi:dual 3',5'-cyclic-AMP and -GMP phosphodiesterase 11